MTGEHEGLQSSAVFKPYLLSCSSSYLFPFSCPPYCAGKLGGAPIKGWQICVERSLEQGRE